MNSLIMILGAVVTLHWIAPTTNENGSVLTDLAGYNVYVGTTSGVYDVRHNVQDLSTTFEVTNLDNNVQYYFAITAYDESGNESDFSLELTQEIKLEKPIGIRIISSLSILTLLLAMVYSMRKGDNED